MKKVVYGIVILIGLLCISTNFIINEKNIDFKKTSASGTACKWISNNSYGVAPLYIDTTKLQPVYDTTVASYRDIYIDNLTVVPCSTANEGQILQAGITYGTDKNTPVSGYFSAKGQITTNKPSGFYVRVENGIVIEKNVCSLYTYNSISGKYTCNETDKSTGLNQKEYFMYSEEYNVSKPSNFTCVCAEY